MERFICFFPSSCQSHSTFYLAALDPISVNVGVAKGILNQGFPRLFMFLLLAAWLQEYEKYQDDS